MKAGERSGGTSPVFDNCFRFGQTESSPWTEIPVLIANLGAILKHHETSSTFDFYQDLLCPRRLWNGDFSFGRAYHHTELR